MSCKVKCVIFLGLIFSKIVSSSSHSNVASGGSISSQPSISAKQQLLQEEMAKPLAKRILNTVGTNIAQAGVDLVSIPAKTVYQTANMSARGGWEAVNTINKAIKNDHKIVVLGAGPFLPVIGVAGGAVLGSVGGSVDALKTIGKQIAHKANRVFQSARLIGLNKEKAAEKMINRELAKIEGKKLDKNLKQEKEKFGYTDRSMYEKIGVKLGFKNLNTRFDVKSKTIVPVDISQSDSLNYYKNQQSSSGHFASEKKDQKSMNIWNNLKEERKKAAKEALKNIDTATMVLDRDLVKNVIKDAINKASENFEPKIKEMQNEAVSKSQG